jgi:hypothetical protein
MAAKRRSKAKSSVSILVIFLPDSRQIIDSIWLIRSAGTTNSAVAIMEGKTPKIIENSEGMC